MLLWKPLPASPAASVEALQVQRLLISSAALIVSMKNIKNTHSKNKLKIPAIATIVIPNTEKKYY